MKKLSYLFAGLLFCSSSIFTLTPVYSADASGVKVAIVDMERVSSETLVAKNIKAQLEKESKQHNDTFNKRGESLKKKEKALIEQKNLLSEEVFRQKIKDLEAELITFSKEKDEAKKKIASATTKSFSEVQTVIDQIIKEIVNEKTLDVVLPKSSVMYANSNLDITNDVIRKLNAKLPSYKINIK